MTPLMMKMKLMTTMRMTSTIWMRKTLWMMAIDLLLKLFPSPLPLLDPLGQKLDQQLARSGGFVKVAEFLRYWCGDRGF